jgi:nucleoside-diphosphate-sugar epimerase
VTGGAGFIGSHLVETLVEKGARVVVLDDFSTGQRENLRSLVERGSIELVEGDLRRREDCARAVRVDGVPVEVVFHQAALGSVPRSMRDPATTLAVNTTGTAEVFTAARDVGVKGVVYASSSSVYGDSDQLPKRVGEEGVPLSPYALSKRAGEEVAAVFARCYGMHFVGLRYFNVYGPRQSPEGPYAAVIPRFFAACRAGRPPEIYGDGEQQRDFTYVGDAVAANLAAGTTLLERFPGAESERQSTEKKEDAQVAGTSVVVNVGGGAATTINQLAAAVRRLCGGAPEPVYRPPRAGDVRASLADLGATEALFGYRPSVALEEGLRRIAQSLDGDHPTMTPPGRNPRR